MTLLGWILLAYMVSSALFLLFMIVASGDPIPPEDLCSKSSSRSCSL